MATAARQTRGATASVVPNTDPRTGPFGSLSWPLVLAGLALSVEAGLAALRPDHHGQPVVMAERAVAPRSRPGTAFVQQGAAGRAGDRDRHAASAGLTVGTRARDRPRRGPDEDKHDGNDDDDEPSFVAANRIRCWRRDEEGHRSQSRHDRHDAGFPHVNSRGYADLALAEVGGSPWMPCRLLTLSLARPALPP